MMIMEPLLLLQSKISETGNHQVGAWSSGRMVKGKEGRLVKLLKDSGRWKTFYTAPVYFYNLTASSGWISFCNLIHPVEEAT